MRKVGYWAALAFFAIGVVYAVVLAVGMMGVGFSQPITDPILAVMEVLTLLSAPAALITMAAVHAGASAEHKFHSLVALVFMTLMAGLTMGVHFVELTALRQMGAAGLVWPSVPYALELLAWDVFLGLSLVFAAPVFAGSRLDRAIRTGMTVTGALCLTGSLGPLFGTMEIQFVAVAGYAVVLPVVWFLVALHFRSLPRQPEAVRMI